MAPSALPLPCPCHVPEHAAAGWLHRQVLCSCDGQPTRLLLGCATSCGVARVCKGCHHVGFGVSSIDGGCSHQGILRWSSTVVGRPCVQGGPGMWPLSAPRRPPLRHFKASKQAFRRSRGSGSSASGNRVPWVAGRFRCADLRQFDEMPSPFCPFKQTSIQLFWPFLPDHGPFTPFRRHLALPQRPASLPLIPVIPSRLIMSV